MAKDDDNSVIQLDDLLVGLTRPTTKWGVPYSAIVLEITFGAIVFLATTNPLHLGIVVPIHIALAALTYTDPLMFEKIRAWSKTKALCALSTYWGAASFGALRCNRYPTTQFNNWKLRKRIQLGLAGRKFRAREKLD